LVLALVGLAPAVHPCKSAFPGKKKLALWRKGVCGKSDQRPRMTPLLRPSGAAVAGPVLLVHRDAFGDHA
jgi:hypothetical protein